jgi:DNA-3-methyladenine glycosylase
VKKVLKPEFFARNTLVVARDLLGKYLVVGNKALMITEVEAYHGHNDLGSHARRGQTPGNTPMFGSPGTVYVYFTYGMHYMLNLVTEEEGYPAAVLIRGVEGINGPGRLTKFLKIDKRFNAKPLAKKTGIWIEDRNIKVEPRWIKKTPRIGIPYAGEYIEKPWRFVLK